MVRERGEKVLGIGWRDETRHPDPLNLIVVEQSIAKSALHQIAVAGRGWIRSYLESKKRIFCREGLAIGPGHIVS